MSKHGAWTVGGAQGVREMLEGREAVDVVLTGWLWRREYTTSTPLEVNCREEGPSRDARVEVTYRRPDLGDPTLTFDLATAALLGETHTQADGSSTRTAFESWSDADATGVRWPTKSTTTPAAGTPIANTYEPLKRGEACVRIDRRGEKSTAEGPACIRPIEDRVVSRWPANGVARVPMKFLGGELVVRVRLPGGREANAFLDSGAGITVVDAAMPAATTFVSTMEMDAQGATQKVRIGLGELPAIDIGELHLEHLPTASVPIPALEAFGDKRPEVILGYTLFALGAVRVDYAKGEIAFSKNGEALVGKNAKGTPLHVIDGKLVADVTIESSSAPMTLDTGNAGAVDLFARWATPHGLPGSRPTGRLKGHFGAGTTGTEDVFFRMQRASLGPIVVEDTLAQISDAPGTSSIAGLLGNLFYSRCDAVVFDHSRRTLWLEGDCKRPTFHARYGWRLARKDDPAHAGRPWTIGSVFPGGTADKAGLRAGDRLLEVGGRPATSDVAPIWRLEQQPEGTKVLVTIARDGKTERMVLDLKAPLR